MTTELLLYEQEKGLNAPQTEPKPRTMQVIDCPTCKKGEKLTTLTYNPSITILNGAELSTTPSLNEILKKNKKYIFLALGVILAIVAFSMAPSKAKKES